jgi:hypothetical protein
MKKTVGRKSRAIVPLRVNIYLYGIWKVIISVGNVQDVEKQIPAMVHIAFL